jgi:hypothetical protein
MEWICFHSGRDRDERLTELSFPEALAPQQRGADRRHAQGVRSCTGDKVALELTLVTSQIDNMARAMAERSKQHIRALPAARELLHLFAGDQEGLRQVAESEPGQRLRCASPGDEPLDACLPAPPPPEQVTLVAADGSQIFPDRHGLVFYYAINVGSIVFRQGSGQAPDVATEPRLFYTDDELYPDGKPVSGDLVSAERDVAEMRVLSDLVLAEPLEGPQRIALADGPLLIWVQRADLPKDKQVQILESYLACLDSLRADRVAVAGFVSRPHSAEVVSLLYLAQLEPDKRKAVSSLGETAFRGLTDQELFAGLGPGERSALFQRGTATNEDFRQRGHAVFFFYLNTAPGGSEDSARTSFARVEIPEWVAKQPQQLDLVHAAVYDQCRLSDGYPYVLTRADEQAVIHGEEREVLETMIVRAMTRHGLPLPELSRKAQQKRVARWRRGS